MYNNRLIHGFKTLDQVKALYSNYRFYSDLIYNPEGISTSIDFNENFTSLLRHLPLYIDSTLYPELGNNICHFVLDNKKGLPADSTLTCYRDYNPYAKNSNIKTTCPRGQFINFLIGACQNCHSSCTYCSNASENACSSNTFYNDSLMTYDIATDTYLPFEISNLDISRYETFTAKANISNTKNYGIDFWFNGCVYTNNLDRTKNFDVTFQLFWDKHLGVQIELVPSPEGGCTSVTNSFGQESTLNRETLEVTSFTYQEYFKDYNFCFKVSYLPIYDKDISEQTKFTNYAEVDQYLPLCAWRKVSLAVNLSSESYKVGGEDWEDIKETVDPEKLISLNPPLAIEELELEIIDIPSFTTCQNSNRNNYNPDKTVDLTIGLTPTSTRNFGFFFLGLVRLFNTAEIPDCSYSGKVECFDRVLLHYFDPNNFSSVVELDGDTSPDGSQGLIVKFNDSIVSEMVFQSAQHESFIRYGVIDLTIGESFNRYIQKDSVVLYYKKDVDYFSLEFPSIKACELLIVSPNFGFAGDEFSMAVITERRIARISYWCEVINSPDIVCAIPIFGQNYGVGEALDINYTRNNPLKESIDYILLNSSAVVPDHLSVQIGADVYYDLINNSPVQIANFITLITKRGEINLTLSLLESSELLSETAATIFSKIFQQESVVRSQLTKISVQATNQIASCYSITQRSSSACPQDPTQYVPNTEFEFDPELVQQFPGLADIPVEQLSSSTAYTELLVSACDPLLCQPCIEVPGSYLCTCELGRTTSCNLTPNGSLTAQAQGTVAFETATGVVPITNPSTQTDIQTRRVLQSSYFVSNFNSTFYDIFANLVALETRLYLDIDIPYNHTMPLLKAINDNISTDENMKNIILNDLDKLFKSIDEMYTFFYGNIEKSKAKNYLTYLKSVNKTEIIPAFNVTFINMNQTNDQQKISFYNVTTTAPIYEFLHNTGNFANELNLEINPNHKFAPLMTYTLEIVNHPQYSLNKNQTLILNEFLSTAEELLYKINDLKISKASVSEVLNYQYSNNYYYLAIRDIQASNNVDTKTLLNRLIGNSTEIEYQTFINADDYYESNLKSLNKFTASYLRIKAVDKFLGYSNTTVTDKVELTFYDQERKPINATTPLIKYYLALSLTNNGLNKYITLNSNRFFKNYDNTKVINEEYKKIITQPFLISSDGTINREYSQEKRIQDMHQEVRLFATYGETNITDSLVRYNNAYIVVDSSQGKNVETRYEIIQPEYKNQSNAYWWNKTQIFEKTENYNRASFIFLIVSFAIYIIGLPTLIIIFHLSKKSESSNILSNPNKVGDIFANNLKTSLFDMVPKKVGAPPNNEDNKKGLDRIQSTVNNDVVVSTAVISNRLRLMGEGENSEVQSTNCWDNVKNGLYSGILRKEKLYSPRYKDIAHLWFFQYFCLLIITILFIFTDLDTSKDITKNWHMYLWYVAITIVTSNILVVIVYLLYSSNKTAKKELSQDDAQTKEIFKKTKLMSLLKSLLLISLNLAIFGFLFYGLTGFTMVFEKYDHVLLVTFLVQQALDFVLFDVIVSVLVSLCSVKDKAEQNCFIRMLMSFTAIRCSD